MTIQDWDSKETRKSRKKCHWKGKRDGQHNRNERNYWTETRDHFVIPLFLSFFFHLLFGGQAMDIPKSSTSSLAKKEPSKKTMNRITHDCQVLPCLLLHTLFVHKTVISTFCCWASSTHRLNVIDPYQMHHDLGDAIRTKGRWEGKTSKGAISRISWSFFRIQEESCTSRDKLIGFCNN
jgi:hypothetical protein